MRIRLKGINWKRKRLADGSFKTYYWAWKGGPPLRGVALDCRQATQLNVRSWQILLRK
jgi:hypothetical protein